MATPTSQVDFGAAPTTGTLTVGALFGLDQSEAAFPMPMPGSHQAQNVFGVPISAQNMGTVLQNVSSLYHMDASTRADTIRQLIAGGYLGPKQGSDQSSVGAAWRAAVIDAARSQVTVLDQLTRAAQQTTAAGGPSDGSGKGNTYIGDPAELGDTINQATQKMLGRDATADERRVFTAAIQAQQRHESSLAAAPGGGQEIQAVNPSAQADVIARNADPVHADARKVVAAAGVLEQMMKGN